MYFNKNKTCFGTSISHTSLRSRCQVQFKYYFLLLLSDDALFKDKTVMKFHFTPNRIIPRKTELVWIGSKSMNKKNYKTLLLLLLPILLILLLLFILLFILFILLLFYYYYYYSFYFLSFLISINLDEKS